MKEFDHQCLQWFVSFLFSLRENLESKSLAQLFTFYLFKGMDSTITKERTNERRFWTTNFNPSLSDCTLTFFLSFSVYMFLSILFTLSLSLSLSTSLFLHWQKIFQINWRCIIQAGVAGSEMFRRWNFVERGGTNISKKMKPKKSHKKKEKKRFRECEEENILEVK